MTKRNILSADWRDWHKKLADAIESSLPGDVIVVNSEAKKELTERAMARMGCENVLVEVEANDG